MKRLTHIILLSMLAAQGRAQILSVPLVAQEQSNWCWAGCSKCILNYYGNTLSQCTIADYTRRTITWGSMGTTDCCTNPHLGCDSTNYEAGHAGSIQDILLHFSHIQSIEQVGPLTQTQITSLIGSNKLFVAFWSWYSGGGHFVVGNGLVGSNVYFMNPWPGEGHSIATYSHMVNDGNHRWDYSLPITTLPSEISEVSTLESQFVYPNPSHGIIHFGVGATKSNISIYSVSGQCVYNTIILPGRNAEADLTVQPKGIYIVEYIDENGRKNHTKLALN